MAFFLLHMIGALIPSKKRGLKISNSLKVCEKGIVLFARESHFIDKASASFARYLTAQKKPTPLPSTPPKREKPLGDNVSQP